MTHTIRTSLRIAAAGFVVAAAIAITGTGAHAQHGHATPGHKAGTQDEHFAHIAATLGLSDQQKAAAKKLHEAAATRAKPLLSKASLQHDEIQAMLEAGNADPTEIGRRVIAMYATHEQLEMVHDQTMAKLSAQLDAQQRAKLQKIQAEHHSFPGALGPCGGGH